MNRCIVCGLPRAGRRVRAPDGIIFRFHAKLCALVLFPKPNKRRAAKRKVRAAKR